MSIETAPSLFPIHVEHDQANDLFQAWFKPRKAEINEKHGCRGFVGRSTKGADASGHIKSWSYYQVTAKIVDERTVVFQTYDMVCFATGGRGKAQEKFEHTYESDKPLKVYVNYKKLRIAETVFRKREEQKRHEAIEAVRKELFGD